MPSQGYADWVAAGRPYTSARPIERIAENIRRWGYTVYERGNDAHMTAVPPEDHTPFSATGWPVASPRWWGHALDIMAPPAGRGLPSLADLGSKIFDDKLAGRPSAVAIKYMNWEPKGSGGPCVHDAWQPTHTRSTSTDYGHIHISIRSDCTTSTLSDNYDPVEELMALSADDARKVWSTDGAVRNRPWRPDYATNATVQAQTALDEAWDEAHEASIKLDKVLAAIAAGMPVTLTDVQLQAIVDEVRAGVVADLRALVFKAEP